MTNVLTRLRLCAKCWGRGFLECFGVFKLLQSTLFQYLMRKAGGVIQGPDWLKNVKGSR